MCVNLDIKYTYIRTISENNPDGTQRKYDAFGEKKKTLYSNMENFEDEYGNPFRAGMSN